MRSFWDDRYAQSEYVYGTEPNRFFKVVLSELTPAKLWLPGDGEGRNGVYAARKGWDVEVFDFSEEARKKAIQLAETYGVDIDYRTDSYETVEVQAEHFDMVGLFYTHAVPATRTVLHRKAVQALKPGGVLTVEYFSKDQLGKNSGGPKDIEMLMSKKELRQDFESLNIIYIEEISTLLSEGAYHQGLASVVRLIAKKNVS
jgi:SAM-dependent methyltransferase